MGSGHSLEKIYRVVFDNSPDAIVVLDPKGTVLQVNQRLEEWLGYQAKEVIGRNLLELPYLPPASRARVFEFFQRRVKGEEIESYDLEFTTRGGEPVIGRVTARVVRDEKGHAVYDLVIVSNLSETRRMETSLQEVTDYLNKIINSIADPVFVKDRQHRFALVNDAECKLTGRSRQEVIGKTDYDFFPKEQVDVFLAKDEEVFETGRENVNEETITDTAGEVHTIVTKKTLYVDKSGSKYIVGVIRDVTDRKKVEKALQESEKRIDEILHALPVGLMVIDEATHKIIDVNDKALQMIAAPRNKVVGQICHKFICPAEEGRCPVNDLGQSMDNSEKTLLTADGREIPILKTVVTIIVGGRKCLIETFFDITDVKRAEELRLKEQAAVARAEAAEADRRVLKKEIADRHRAEEALQMSESQYRMTVDSMDDAIHVVDTDMNFLLFNKAFQDLNRRLGLETKVIGRPWHTVFPFLPPSVVEEYRKVFKTGEPMVSEDRLQIKGREFISETRKIPVIEAGRVVRIVTVVRDITERRQKEESARQLEARVRDAQKLESLGVLAGGIAHDFNNLLMTILGNADIALLELPPSAAVRQRMENIVTASIRASELTKQMLAYSGKGRYLIQLVDLNQVVGEMASLLQVSISKKAELKYELGAGLPLLEGDVSQVRQIVMNLITNASDALGDRGGVIRLKTGTVEADQEDFADNILHEDLPPGSYLFLEVGDTGCGMDERTKTRIFEPFFSTKFLGRGLGLAAVLGIVRGHRGALKVYSEPGKGSVFTVLFPCSDKRVEVEAERRAVTTAAATRKQGATILVVEDEADVRQVTTLMLEMAGFKVISANDGQEGLAVFREHAPNIALVILDLSMPRMSGEEALEELRKVRPEVRVILSSGYAEEHVRALFKGEGPTGFIQKPYVSDDLLRKVQIALS